MGVECNAARKAFMRFFESPDYSTRLDVPDLEAPVPARRGEEFAIGAEREAVDLRLVAKDDRFHPAEPHEVVPLPPAQVFGALFEELEGALQVIDGQLPVGQADAVEVGVPPLALEGLLEVLV